VKKITLNLCGRDWSGVLRCDNYRSGDATALIFDEEDGEQIAVLSVNLPDALLPDQNHTFIKDYSENEGVLAQLIQQGIVRDTGIKVSSGFVQIPLVEIIASELREHGAPPSEDDDDENEAKIVREWNSLDEGRSDGQGESYAERNA
jgi:hypothetical protein